MYLPYLFRQPQTHGAVKSERDECYHIWKLLPMVCSHTVQEEKGLLRYKITIFINSAFSKVSMTDKIKHTSQSGI